MIKLINFISCISSRRLHKKDNLSENKLVEYSVKKYRKTYKLLEEYDKKAVQDPQKLAKPGRLQPYLRDIRGASRIRRADSPI